MSYVNYCRMWYSEHTNGRLLVWVAYTYIHIHVSTHIYIYISIRPLWQSSGQLRQAQSGPAATALGCEKLGELLEAPFWGALWPPIIYSLGLKTRIYNNNNNNSNTIVVIHGPRNSSSRSSSSSGGGGRSSSSSSSS